MFRSFSDERETPSSLGCDIHHTMRLGPQNNATTLTMTARSHPASWQIVLILIGGILCVSTAAIWIRLAVETAGGGGVGLSLVLSASRLTLASLVLLPNWRTMQQDIDLKTLGLAAVSGLCLALHFACWTTSLSYTSIAASTTLVTTNPIWVAILSRWWFGERLKPVTLLGMGVALAGGTIVGWSEMGETAIAVNPPLGNFLALMGSWVISVHLLLGRTIQQRGLDLRRYVTVTYTVAALVLLPLPRLFGASYSGYPPLVYLCIALMAIFPQLLGHTSLNWAVRWVSPTLVTLAILLEPIAASLFGFWVFGEVPSKGVAIGAVLLLVGVGIATLNRADSTSDRDRSES